MTETTICTWEGCSKEVAYVLHDKNGCVCEKLCSEHYWKAMRLLHDVLREEGMTSGWKRRKEKGMELRLSDLAVVNSAGQDVAGWMDEYKFFDEAKVEVLEDRTGSFSFRLYTDANAYTIVARRSSEADYLGCAVVARKARSGETWMRGNDLPDGKYTRDTWDKIVGAILFYEVHKIARDICSCPSVETVEMEDCT